MKLINPLTAGVAYVGFFTQLLPHSVPPFKHGKAIICDINQHYLKRVDLQFAKSE